MTSASLRRRIAARLADMPLRRDALHEAMAAIDPEFDRRAFIEAANSGDPKALSTVMAVERGFEILQNYIAELARFGLMLAGLRAEDEAPNARHDFERLRDAGVVSAERCRRLIRLQNIRNMIAHEYTDVMAEQVHEGVSLLLSELPGFVEDYDRWMRELGARP